MDFIFMLTHHDRTVANCLAVFDETAELGLRHIGFKDVGVDSATLKELTRRIKASGATAYVEVVSTDPRSIRASISAAASLRVDRVLGGQDIVFAQEALGAARASYYPFAGRPVGHPTQLFGNAGLIEEHCRMMCEEGCAGVDLLAYRAQEAEPLDLIKAARRGLGSQRTLIVAGSVDSPDRIQAIQDAGADAFTIGSAIFDDSFDSRVHGVRAQCEAVLKAMGR
jgi:hypothetical protein